jgi:predicted nucleic acid-binding protein
MWDIRSTRPHLIDIEVAQVSDFPLHRYPHDVLLPRVWELRHNLTAYDAVYVALAEVLDAPLLTRDRRVATAAGHRARVDLV